MVSPLCARLRQGRGTLRLKGGQLSARVRLPWWPVVAAVVLVVASCLLAVLIVPGVNTDSMLPEAIVGYVLTPFAVTGALMLARRKDLKLQGNPAYLRLDGQRRIRIVGLLVGLSFIPAVLHIWYIASYMGSKWS